MIHQKEQSYVFTSYCFLDLVSASGGIISGMIAVFGPLAGLFSRLNFDLGVMELLFSARTLEDVEPSNEDQKEDKTTKKKILRYHQVNISSW